MSLAQYAQKFAHLRTDRSHGIAPHKPVLLLAVLDGIEKGEIMDNRISITPELVATFVEIWQMLVKDGPFEPRFALPFFHLRSEGFWQLVAFPGLQPALTNSNSIRSFSSLKETIAWAEIDVELFDWMSQGESRKVLRYVLLDAYFPITKNDYLRDRMHEGEYLHALEREVLANADGAREEALAEEELFLRSSAFRKAIPRAYDYTCAISGMRVAAAGIMMIDACHIVPFSTSHDDTIGNGIALCPNFHRAFDRHLIAVDDDYRVMMKKPFTESVDTDYGLKKFDGKKLLLPREEKFWPLRANLAWHREYR